MIELLLILAAIVAEVIPEHFKGQHAAGWAVLAFVLVLFLARIILFRWVLRQGRRITQDKFDAFQTRSRRGF